MTQHHWVFVCLFYLVGFHCTSDNHSVYCVVNKWEHLWQCIVDMHRGRRPRKKYFWLSSSVLLEMRVMVAHLATIELFAVCLYFDLNKYVNTYLCK